MVTPDSELILESYRKWGEDCVQKLVGDFAFAIWDPHSQRFFCARDAMGIKCLYYFLSDSLFVFGSEIKALCCLPDVPKKLNELRILDYLANVFDDRAITFYKDIWRLPPASILTVGQKHVRRYKYWSLDPHRELKLKSDAEYTEAFQECFVRSVRDRMRSAYPVGSALSGGLDSSSIACVAKSISQRTATPGPFHTFSLIFPSLPEQDLRHIDERKYIQDVLALGGFQPHFIRADELSPMKDVSRVHDHLDEATCAPNLYLHWAMYQAASRAGVRVFLDGFDGDGAISYGLDHLKELALRLRWKTLHREAQLLANNLGLPAATIIRLYCLKPLCPDWMYRLWRQAHGQSADYGFQTFLADHFKQRMGFDRRVRRLSKTSRTNHLTARANHKAGIEQPLYSYALELADKASAAFRTEARYPFFDRRLIELCLSLPAAQKLGQGWVRLILRRAMSGYLPESVQWRLTKGNLSFNFARKMLEYDRCFLEDSIVRDPSELEPYVDLPAIRLAYESYKTAPLESSGSLNLFAAANLATWLRGSGVRP